MFCLGWRDCVCINSVVVIRSFIIISDWRGGVGYLIAVLSLLFCVWCCLFICVLFGFAWWVCVVILLMGGFGGLFICCVLLIWLLLVFVLRLLVLLCLLLVRLVSWI